MSEEVKNVTEEQVAETVQEEVNVVTENENQEQPEVTVTDEEISTVVKRVEELQNLRSELASLNEELVAHQKDLANAETIFGTGSKEYELQVGHVDLNLSRIEETKKKIEELTFKRSELKPVLDALAKKFEDAYRNDTIREYHIEMAPKPEKEDEPIDPSKGKKVFKQLLEYLNHNVSFTAKTAVNLMVLVRNMEENKAWVNSKEFDNVIILRSASVLSLWKSIMEDFNGKGFYEARTFLECWANCGQSISDAVRQIQKDNVSTRQIGTDLNNVEEEFDRSEDDLPHDETQISTQEEVAPEVSE